MIRRLSVRGWRAFDDLTLELADGLTFVVAENGVGKTSLVQAAAWGLYGQLSHVDAQAARRVGTEVGRVEVELELPDGRMLTVEREVRPRAQTMRADVAGTELDESGLARVLGEAFGASQEFLSMTTVVPSDPVAGDDTRVFHLQSHLRRVFGVDQLQRAAETLQRLHDEAAAQARTTRQASRQTTADLSRLRDELAAAEAALASARTAREQARQVLDLAETLLREARHQQQVLSQAVRARQEFTEVLTAARQLLGRGAAAGRAVTGRAALGRVARPADLAVRLEAAETAVADALDDCRRRAASVTGQLAAVRSAARALHTAQAECPVCRRELSAGDVARASAAHEWEVADLQRQERELTAEVDAAADRLNEVRALTRRALRLPDTLPPTKDSGPDVDAAAFAVEVARADLERLDEEAGAARARRAGLAGRVAEEERRADAMRRATLVHRREAVTSVAAEAMRATADQVLAQRIDPLAAEISHRWKRIFGERGTLHLRSDGHLVLVRGVHEIAFSQFSSGEKVVALLATRLLILGASTRASFLWLDEPLEHLDPRNRRIIASLMSASGANVRQILVTTYEDALARRLAATASAQVRYVRADTQAPAGGPGPAEQPG